MIVNDNELVAAARRYIGTPWRDRGRSTTGLDCIGLLAVAMRDCGVPGVFRDTLGSPRDYFVLKPVLCRYAARIASARFGALLLYKMENLKIIHVAIATDDGAAISIAGPGHKVAEASVNFPIRQTWGVTWQS